MMTAIINATIIKQESKLNGDIITYLFRFFDSENNECTGYFELHKDKTLLSEYIDIKIPIIVNETGKLTYYSVQDCTDHKAQIKDFLNAYEVDYIYIYGRK